jgi:hypothetical protein
MNEKRNKKAISHVVIAITLLVIALISLGAVWALIKKILQDQGEEISFDKITISAGINGARIQNETNTIFISVKRNAGRGNLVGFNFIFMNGSANIEVKTISASIGELDERIFSLNPNMPVSSIVTITLVPLIKIGNEEIIGSVGRVYEINSLPKIDPISYEDPFSCIPATCASRGYVCGTIANGTCSGTLNCGECDSASGYSCVRGKCQTEIDCIRDTCSGLGYECEIWDDGCRGVINCGNCTIGKSCVSGKCQTIPLDKSLILWLKFDDTITDGIATDSSGRANHGTCSGSSCPAYLSTGGPGGTGAYQFNGMNDRIQVNDKAILGGMKELSVCFWVNIKSKADWNYILSKNTDNFATSSYGMSLDDSPSQKITFGIKTSAGTAAVKTNTPELLNKWYHICGVYNGSELSIWEEGAKQLITSRRTGLITDTSLPIKIGMAENSLYFNGTIDDVRIFNKSLIQSEIESIYHQTAPICIPMTCADLGYECGQANDGCKQLIDCGGCDTAAGYICIGGACKSKISCTPDCAGKQCGSDGCGDNSNCGTCGSNQECDANGQCIAITSGDIVMRSSISQYGITWTFDKQYQTGQFANGDYWVMGPVKITRITPDYSGGHNGWEVNPVPGYSQGFDSGCGGFKSSLIPSLPYTANAGESIVKSVKSSGGGRDERICLSNAGVLTVVSSPPPGNGASVFRPPYVGDDKPYYHVSTLKTYLLPSLAPAGSNVPSFSSLEKRYKQVQLDHGMGEMGRWLHPYSYMPDYGSDIAQENGDAALRLMLNDPPSSKKPLLLGYVQYGIDLYAMVWNGQTWPDGGGHRPGQILPLAFAAVMLDNQQMKATLQGVTFLEEDKYLTYSTRINKVLYGRTEGEDSYWQTVMTDNGGRSKADPYGYIDGGPYPGGRYQMCCTSQPFKGEALAFHLMPSMKSVHNVDKLLKYADRWVDFGIWSQKDPCAPHTSGTYKVNFGPNPNRPGECILDKDLTPGSTFTSFSCQSEKECGRFPSRHGDAADGGDRYSNFQRDMWNVYR